MFDLLQQVKASRAISPVTQTNADTAIVSEILDVQLFGSLLFLIAYGNMTDANATVAALLEHGDAANLSDAAAVDDADMISMTDGTAPEAAAGAAAASDDHKVRKLAYRGIKRYVRLTLTPTGNDAGALPVCAIAVQAHPVDAPVA